MTEYLSALHLCPYLPNDQRDQLDALKSDLIQSLDRQINQVEAQLNDGVFIEMVRAWLRCEDEDISLPVDRFYWQHRSGAWIITLSVDGDVVPITADRPSVEVGHADDIPNALDLLKRATKAGELDEQLKDHIEQQISKTNILSDTLDVIPYMDACDRHHLQQIVQAFELRHQAKKLLQIRDKTGEHC